MKSHFRSIAKASLLFLSFSFISLTLIFFTQTTSVAATVGCRVVHALRPEEGGLAFPSVRMAYGEFRGKFDFLGEVRNPAQSQNPAANEAFRNIVDDFDVIAGSTHFFTGSPLRVYPFQVRNWGFRTGFLESAETRLRLSIEWAANPQVDLYNRRRLVESAIEFGKNVLAEGKGQLDWNSRSSHPDPDLEAKLQALEGSVTIAERVSKRLYMAGHLLEMAGGFGVHGGTFKRLTALEISKEIIRTTSNLENAGFLAEANDFKKILAQLAKEPTLVIPSEKKPSAETFLALDEDDKFIPDLEGYKSADFEGDITKVNLTLFSRSRDESGKENFVWTHDPQYFYLVGSSMGFYNQNFRITDVKFSEKRMFVELTGQSDKTKLIVQALEDGTTVTWLLRDPTQYEILRFQAGYRHSN
ncbi:MAG: hypothetical protein C5B49_13245 [Bdellovibrio sp.]|nr:MAG: hypothetical protein C5B49_13245 [Bdellovibrio sp.]